MKTKTQKTAKAIDGGDVHIGQVLYNRAGDSLTVTAIKGDKAVLSGDADGDMTVPLAEIRSSEKAGLVGTSNPALMNALSDDSDDQVGS